jgi:ketosteroid isomerase-like protein
MPKPASKVMFATADETEQAFYDCLARADLPGLMSLWAEEDDVICIHPGGPRLEGLDAIRASWQAILGNGTLEINVTRQTAISGMLISVHTLIEEIMVQGENGPELLYVNATNVYHKTSRGWRLVLHHASPATEAPSTPPASALH